MFELVQPPGDTERFAIEVVERDGIAVYGADLDTPFSLAEGRVLATLKESTERGLDGQGAVASGEPVVVLAHREEGPAGRTSRQENR